MGVVEREILCFSYALCRFKSSAAHGLLGFLFPPVNEWMLILLAPSDTWPWLSNTVLPPSDWSHWELKLPFPSSAGECRTPDSSPADNPPACCSHQSHSNRTAGAAVRLPLPAPRHLRELRDTHPEASVNHASRTQKLGDSPLRPLAGFLFPQRCVLFNTWVLVPGASIRDHLHHCLRSGTQLSN